MKPFARLLLLSVALLLSACEAVNDHVIFPRFDLIKQDGNVRLYAYRSAANHMYPADSDIAEKRRIEQLEVQLASNKLPSKDYKVISRELEYVRRDRVNDYPVHFVHYVVQVPANP